MGSSDAFTVHDASTDAANETAESISTDVEYKYAQLTVPSFQYDASGSSFERSAEVEEGDPETHSYSDTSSSAKTSGHSFLRLGSFPKITATTSVSTDGEETTTATAGTDAPSGFLNSLDLALLVGHAASIDAVSGSDEGPGDSGIVRESKYAGDGDYLLGFTDDTRARKNDALPDLDDDSKEKTFIDGATVDNDAETRLKETQRLLTKGGWWDHSDGNRVSTTSGDKVEVIQGNYKMVILGRQDPKSVDIGRVAVTDFSGGHFQEQYTSPTPAIKSVGWVKDTEGWSLFQDNGSGHVTTKFHGKQVDIFTGSKKESIVGSDPESTITDPKSLMSEPDEDKDPVVVSKTWAKEIQSYTGSVTKPVPHMYSFTWAGAKEDLTFAASVVATTSASSVVTTTIGLVDILSFNAGATITGINVTKLLTQIDITPQKLEVTLGARTTFDVKRINFRVEEEEVHASKTELAAAEQRLMGHISQVLGTDQSVAGRRVSVSADDTEISMATRITISSMHSIL